MNQRERAQQLMALLTQLFESDWASPESAERISIFEGEELARVEVPNVDGLTVREACARSVGAGFVEGFKFARTAIELVAVAGKLIDENDPAVDFRGVLQMLGIYAAALPDDEE